jgi:hypothetical protein
MGWAPFNNYTNERKPPMKALIDGDIFAYEFGNCTNDEYVPLSWPLVQARVQSRINGIIEATGADEYQIYLTSEDGSNFKIREFLVDHREAEVVYGMEADDALSIAQYQAEDKRSTVICSRDKDLNMVPGYHYSWGAGKQKEKGLWWQDEINGLRAFYCQLLTGDSTDNIPGLYGVGGSSKLLTHVREFDREYDMYLFALAEYTKRFGTYAERFLIENARLLWMQSYEGELWSPPSLPEGITDADE